MKSHDLGDVDPDCSDYGLLMLQPEVSKSVWWKVVDIDNAKIKMAYAEIEKRSQTHKDLGPEFQFVASSRDVDTYLYVYRCLPKVLKIRWHAVCRGSLNTRTWEINMSGKPRIRSRDMKFERQLHKPLSKLIEAAEQVTEVEFYNESNEYWERMTPFEVASVAVNIYYLHQYTDDRQHYPVRQIEGEEMLETFRCNIRKMNRLIHQDGSLCKERLREINFSHLILNIEIIGEYSPLSDDALIERGNDGIFTAMADETGPWLPRQLGVLCYPSLPGEKPIITKGRTSFSGRKSALEALGHGAVLESRPHVDTSQSSALETGLTSAKSMAFTLRLTAISPQDPAIWDFLDGKESFGESENIEDTDISTDRSTPSCSISSPATSLDDPPIDEPRIQDVTVKLKEAANAEATPRKRSRNSTTSSESSKGETDSRKKERPRVVVDLTLSSGVLVTRGQQHVRDQSDLHILPTLAASLSSMQISDSTSIRDLRKRHDAKTFGNGSRLSLPSTRSGKSSIFKGLFPAIVSTESSSHGCRRKKVKRSKYPEEDDGFSNGLSLFRFNR